MRGGSSPQKAVQATVGEAYVTNVMLDFAGTFLVEIVICYAWVKLLHIKNARLFAIVYLGCLYGAVFLRNVVPTEARFIWLICFYVAWPFIMSADGPARKFFVVALVNIAIMMAEVLGSAFWIALTGLNRLDYDVARANLGAFFLTHAAHLFLLILLLLLLNQILSKGESEEENRGFRYFLWFPVTQALLVGLLLAIRQYLLPDSVELQYISCALMTLFAVANALMFLSMRSYSQKTREGQRASLLQGQLDEYLAEYKTLVGEVERASKLRHDLRNQVQLVKALAERGDYDAARDHVRELAVHVAVDPA